MSVWKYAGKMNSEYQLTRALPREFKSVLPSIEEIEAELSGRETGNDQRTKK